MEFYGKIQSLFLFQSSLSKRKKLSNLLEDIMSYAGLLCLGYSKECGIWFDEDVLF